MSKSVPCTNHDKLDERHLCDASHICQSGRDSVASLCQVTAGDIMTDKVQSVSAHWSISALAKFFISHHISGAPVIDENGQAIGVVSATDIMEFENISYKEKLEITRSSYYQEFVGQQLSERDLEQLSLHAEENCTTDSIMTPDIISVQRNASLPAVARLMSRRHIHRVFVSDGDDIVGVISTTDVLEAVGKICGE